MTPPKDPGDAGGHAPLRGIRVIDYSHFLAGPYLSRCLASMGAEVIKVERPTRGDAGRAHPYFIDGHSGYFLQQNMGKQGLCVNVREPRGLELMHRLVDTADVFVENYRPGRARPARSRLCSALSERNPRLVYCSISAYGHSGPDADNAGFGLIAEAKSGAMAMIGVPRRGATAVPDCARRHVHRDSRRGRGQCGAAGARDERTRPAHRPLALRLHGLDP